MGGGDSGCSSACGCRRRNLAGAAATARTLIQATDLWHDDQAAVSQHSYDESKPV